MKAIAKFVQAFANLLDKFTHGLMTLSVIVVFLMIIVQVFFRYVLRASLGGIEELPVYIVALCVWLAAPNISKIEGHVRIDIITSMFKAKWVERAFLVFSNLVAAGGMVYFTILAFQYVRVTYGYGEVTAGTRIPIWIFHAVICYGAVMITVYSIANALKNLIAMAKNIKEEGKADAN